VLWQAATREETSHPEQVLEIMVRGGKGLF